MTNTVIISYWAKRSPKPLFNLLQQLEKHDAEAPFSLAIVCNGGDGSPLQLPDRFKNLDIEIHNRPNTGYNIGAWEYGWRQHPDSQYFLFLQDDCSIVRDGWLRGFLNQMNQSTDIGLVGESIYWKQSWEKLKLSLSNSFLKGHALEGKRVRRVDLYLDFLAKHGIPSTETAEHLQSLVLFTSRSILERIDGFVLGNNYGEAIASEIAISKKVQVAGYRIAQVHPQAFYYIGHSEWPERSRLRRLWKKLWRLGA